MNKYILTDKEFFVLELAIVVVQFVPLVYVDKTSIMESKFIEYDDLLNIYSNKDNCFELHLESEELDFILSSLDICIREEKGSLSSTGKSACLEVYLSDRFGGLGLELFESIFEKLNVSEE
jgi:hypothetical protein